MNCTLQKKILVTGGSGLLGEELKKNLPEALFPTHDEFDITDFQQLCEFMAGKDVDLILHGAAFTSPPKVDADPVRAMEVNIIGTANLVKLCSRLSAKLVYISTDYVFKGDQGNYSEDSAVLPVNKYAWSKLGGECAVRMYEPHLIIRTSFGPNEFPYPKAFVDQWTSRLTVREFALRMLKAVDSGVTGTLHVGGRRQTVLEYARQISPAKEVGELSVHDVDFTPPVDTSLDTSKYAELVEKSTNNRGAER